MEAFAYLVFGLTSGVTGYHASFILFSIMGKWWHKRQMYRLKMKSESLERMQRSLQTERGKPRSTEDPLAKVMELQKANAALQRNLDKLQARVGNESVTVTKKGSRIYYVEDDPMGRWREDRYVRRERVVSWGGYVERWSN